MKRSSKLPARAIHTSPIIHRGRAYHTERGERRPMCPAERYHRHGPIQPMGYEPGRFRRFMRRLLGDTRA